MLPEHNNRTVSSESIAYSGYLTEISKKIIPEGIADPVVIDPYLRLFISSKKHNRLVGQGIREFLAHIQNFNAYEALEASKHKRMDISDKDANSEESFADISPRRIAMVIGSLPTPTNFTDELEHQVSVARSATWPFFNPTSVFTLDGLLTERERAGFHVYYPHYELIKKINLTALCPAVDDLIFCQNQNGKNQPWAVKLLVRAQNKGKPVYLETSLPSGIIGFRLLRPPEKPPKKIRPPIATKGLLVSARL